MAERDIQHAIRVELAKEPDLVLWRNSAGVASFGQGQSKQTTRFGLVKGASDLIGILTLPSGVGRFVAIEVKTDDGKPTMEQRLFLELVRKMGGGAGPRSVGEAKQLIRNWRTERGGEVVDDAGRID